MNGAIARKLGLFAPSDHDVHRNGGFERNMILQLIGFLAVICWALCPSSGMMLLRLLIALYALGIGSSA